MGSLPSAQHKFEKAGEAEISGQPFQGLAALTRLPIHREGHRDKEAKRHRGGAARQSKFCAARQGPALHLETWEKQGLRAALLQDSQPVFPHPLLCLPSLPLLSPNSCVAQLR